MINLFNPLQFSTSGNCFEHVFIFEILILVHWFRECEQWGAASGKKSVEFDYRRRVKTTVAECTIEELAVRRKASRAAGWAGEVFTDRSTDRQRTGP